MSKKKTTKRTPARPPKIPEKFVPVVADEVPCRVIDEALAIWLEGNLAGQGDRAAEVLSALKNATRATYKRQA